MKIKLKVPHTHNGVMHLAGAVLDVGKADGAWLIATGRCSAMDKPTPPQAKPTPTAKPTPAPTAAPAQAATPTQDSLPLSADKETT